jgi:lipid II:glycine glycyltransferase (peptidoglycan interpeptide bridge formation enzyme)
MGLFDGQKIVSGFQVTLHPVPKTAYFVGYVPKCVMPDEQMIQALKQVASEYRCIFIKLEPNIGTVWQEDNNLANKQLIDFLFSKGCVYGRPLFTKYSFQLDLAKTEQELFMNLKQKTRYNVRVAQKAGVQIIEDNSPQAFDEYLKLTFETTKRQQFYAHNPDYHKKMWSVLNPSGMAHLLKAVYQGKTLVTWVLFVFNNFLYYPYGASSSQDRQVMASNLMMWEAIRFGKSKNCRKFDLWGSLGPNADPKDPWYGFHKFKEGYNPALIQFVGTFDLIINPTAYKLYNIADNLRWKALKLKAMLPF